MRGGKDGLKASFFTVALIFNKVQKDVWESRSFV